MTLQNLKKRLLVSFSGGKTSAYMAQRLLRDHSYLWEEIVVAFANTGQEHEKTLEYVDACDRQYGLGVVWLEADVQPERGVGTKHRRVTFKTASRAGEPFEEYIRKFGLPNTQFPECTRETKVRPLTSYLRSLGWKAGTYNTAVGIRADEMDRMSEAALASGYVYPLVDWGICKEDVLSWESKQPVRLGIPEHLGNCTWCWKKSLRKLATVARETPECFVFPRRVEELYRNAGAGFGDRRMFRGRRTVADIFAVAADPSFVPYTDTFKWQSGDMDLGSACGESCEIGADDPDIL